MESRDAPVVTEASKPVSASSIKEKAKGPAGRKIINSDMSGQFMRTEPLERVEQEWLKYRTQLTNDFKRKKKGSKVWSKKKKSK